MRSRSLLVAVLAGCASAPRAAPAPRGAVDESASTRCELASDGARCQVVNHSSREALGCFELYLGVKRTGDLYSADRRICSTVLAPGQSQEMVVPLEVSPSDVCGETLDGCRLLTASGGETVTMTISFAHELESGATNLGARPRWSECEALMTGVAPQTRTAATLLCLGMPRHRFDCMRTATSEDAREHCSTRDER